MTTNCRDYKTKNRNGYSWVKQYKTRDCSSCSSRHLLTKDFKNSHDSIEWRDIIGMRHILVHGYYQIKDEIIWATIETELKPLKDNIQKILE